MTTQAIGKALRTPLMTYKKKTTIGRSNYSRPLNKHKRRNWKKYRGQGG